MRLEFKVTTWNINSLRVRLPHILQWLEREQPDVLALQELKLPTEEFPFEVFRAIGYDALVNGQKTYNGVAILYKQGLVCEASVVTDLPTLDDHQRRVLAATINGIRIVNLYVPNGESVTSEKYRYKLNWLAQLKEFLHQELQTYTKMIVLGDFNIAPAAIDVHDPAKWEGSVLFSQDERAALEAITVLGFYDCFRQLSPTQIDFSWWDYRLYAFKRNLGLRIDLILATKELMEKCSNSLIDKEPRSWERPSDHAPVTAIFSA